MSARGTGTRTRFLRGGLRVRELTVEYQSGRERVRPLDGFSMEAEAGELVLVVGPSGCGKTSLLSCLAGILTPLAGSIQIDGIEIPQAGPRLVHYRRHTIGVMFQAFNLVPSLSALENVALPLVLAGRSRRDSRARAGALLEQMQLGHRGTARPGSLSGGQQQRVAIARALALDPPLVLADEPTAHLHAAQVEGVVRILRDLAAPGRLVIVSTHDTRLLPIADRIVDLTPVRPAEDDAPHRVFLRDGETVFAQGDPGDLAYVVESGAVTITRSDGDGPVSLLTVVEPGAYFGELAPMLGLPRSATATARGNTTLTGYPMHLFRKLVAPSPAAQHSPVPQPAEPIRPDVG